MLTLNEFIAIVLSIIGFSSLIGLLALYIDRSSNAKKSYEIYQDNHGFFIKVYTEYIFLKRTFKSNFILQEDIPSIERKLSDGDLITRIKYFSVLEEVENYIKKLSNPPKLIKKIE